MKKSLTSNLGLKVLSLVASIFLWLIVVNVDDPTISRTYSGIPVEIENASVITGDGKTYEIIDGTDTISVVVTAKRSVIEDMSRDYIKATSDLKELTFMNTAPIQVRSLRYSDRIDSISPITRNLRIEVEEMQKKQLKIVVDTIGEPADGYVTGTAGTEVNIVSVSGPVSVVSEIASARASVDVTGMSSKISTSSPVSLYDEDGGLISDDRLKMSISEVHVDVEILSTKVIPLSYGQISGEPAEGCRATGVIVSDPDSVRIAGIGRTFNELNSLEIPSEILSIAGASGNVSYEVDVTKYLPDGIILADRDYDGMAQITIYVEAVAVKELLIPTGNISVTNLPEGFSAMIVETEGTKNLKIQGLQSVLDGIDASQVTGSIDASAMIPQDATQITAGQPGTYEAEVSFALPAGVSVTEPVTVQILLSPFITDGTAVQPDPQAVNNEVTPPEAGTAGTEVMVPAGENNAVPENAGVLPEGAVVPEQVPETVNN
ncbi:MAG: hypothetical protein K6B28_02550 [Lachnospiraceae bacterium]|nr:hypothetical protein [Lachnospiraceae bacterium]